MESSELVDIVRQIIDRNSRLCNFIVETKEENTFFLEGASKNAIEVIWSHIAIELSKKALVDSIFKVSISWENENAVVWADKTPIILRTNNQSFNFSAFKPGTLRPPVFIALGGLSGSGKSSIVKLMLSREPNLFLVQPAYTTRVKRQNEVDGVDYYFKTDEDLRKARKDPKFFNFVSARNNWYWNDSVMFINNLWSNPERVFLSLVSQIHEFQLRKRLFPELKWIWVEASNEEILERLVMRGDTDFEETLNYNAMLETQSVIRKIDLLVVNHNDMLEKSCDNTLSFIHELRQATKK